MRSFHGRVPGTVEFGGGTGGVPGGGEGGYADGYPGAYEHQHIIGMFAGGCGN